MEDLVDKFKVPGRVLATALMSLDQVEQAKALGDEGLRRPCDRGAARGHPHTAAFYLGRDLYA